MFLGFFLIFGPPGDYPDPVGDTMSEHVFRSVGGPEVHFFISAKAAFAAWPEVQCPPTLFAVATAAIVQDATNVTIAEQKLEGALIAQEDIDRIVNVVDRANVRHVSTFHCLSSFFEGVNLTDSMCCS